MCVRASVARAPSPANFGCETCQAEQAGKLMLLDRALEGRTILGPYRQYF